MEKNGKQYVCTPYQPFGSGAFPKPYGMSFASALPAAAAPGGAADTSPLHFPDGGAIGLPAPAPEAFSADPTALTNMARQYVTSFKAQQPSGSPSAVTMASQAPAADPLFANLLDGEASLCILAEKLLPAVR